MHRQYPEGNHINYDYEYSHKILLVGANGAGKSSLLFRIVDNTFTESHITSIGVDFKIKTISLSDNRRAKLHLFDQLSYYERFKAFNSLANSRAHGILLVVDLTDMNSLEGISGLLYELERYHSETLLYIVANKLDLPNDREVTDNELEKFASDLKNRGLNVVGVSKVSAKQATNVDQAITDFSNQIQADLDAKVQADLDAKVPKPLANPTQVEKLPVKRSFRHRLKSIAAATTGGAVAGLTGGLAVGGLSAAVSAIPTFGLGLLAIPVFGAIGLGIGAISSLVTGIILEIRTFYKSKQSRPQQTTPSNTNAKQNQKNSHNVVQKGLSASNNLKNDLTDRQIAEVEADRRNLAAQQRQLADEKQKLERDKREWMNEKLREEAKERELEKEQRKLAAEKINWMNEIQKQKGNQVKNQPVKEQMTEEELLEVAKTSNFTCSISQEIMKDPVICADGQTYERAEIEKWFEKNKTSPITREKLTDTKVIPNIALRNSIEKFLQDHPEMEKEQYGYEPPVKSSPILK